MAPSLDAQIDGLYQQPLSEFTAARNALAKTLGRDDAARVKKLAKPSVVAWAVNQVYWRARKSFDRAMAAGERLRKTQIAALGGKSAKESDQRGARAAHQQAVAAAVGEAARLAAAAGVHPDAEQLAVAIDALSLAANPPKPPGRLVEPLKPAGFEALSGIRVADVVPNVEPRTTNLERHAERRTPNAERRTTSRTPNAEPRTPNVLDHKRALALAGAEARARDAAGALERAEADFARAKAALDRAKNKVAEAEQELERLRAK